MLTESGIQKPCCNYREEDEPRLETFYCVSHVRRAGWKLMPRKRLCIFNEEENARTFMMFVERDFTHIITANADGRSCSWSRSSFANFSWRWVVIEKALKEVSDGNCGQCGCGREVTFLGGWRREKGWKLMTGEWRSQERVMKLIGAGDWRANICCGSTLRKMKT